MAEENTTKENDNVSKSELGDLLEVREKYYIGSNGESPEKIYFTRIDAFSSYHAYIDSFDETGIHYTAYKLVDNVYTSNF